MPGTPSTKWSLPTLAGADLINQTDEYSVALTGAIDPLLAPSDQGALASRPVSTVGSPGKSGRTYFATDTGQLFRDNGTGWDEIQIGNNNGVWRPFLTQNMSMGDTGSAGVVYLQTGGSGLSTTDMPIFHPVTISDYAVAGRTTRLRIRASLICNDFGPGMTITAGLYALTAIHGSDSLVPTVGSNVLSCRFASPTATSSSTLASTQIDASTLSSGTAYVLGFSYSAAPAANFFASLTVGLEMRNT